MEKKKWLVDVPVLLIFFIRPDTFAQVFEKVRQARPSKLFLACDGPREGTDDKEKIEQCKKIAEAIDWECEVHTDYAEQNLGCGTRPYSAIAWAFSFVDRLVILEDDCVVDPTLFTYQKELLERYRDDNRVAAISGFNHFKEWTPCQDSYLFTKTGATLAWGTWRRVWELYDFYVKQGISPSCERLMRKEIRSKRTAQIRITEWKNIEADIRAKGKVDYWDLQFGYIKFTQSMLTIVPQHNLVCNVGIGAGSTHAATQVQHKWHPGDILLMPTKAMAFPMKHPAEMICDHAYDEKYYNDMKAPNLAKRLIRKVRMTFRTFRK